MFDASLYRSLLRVFFSPIASHSLVLIVMIASLLVVDQGFAKNKQEKAATDTKTIVNSVSKKQMLLLKRADSKYQNDHGIHVKLKKTTLLAMLGTTKTSEGELWLDGGKMRLEINRPKASKIIADNNFLWIETPSPDGDQKAKPQVLKASLKSKRAKSQGLIQLLTRGGVLKYFRVSGVQATPEQVTYFLQPDKQAIEFKRAQIVVSTKTKEIMMLSYWDQVDNETKYDFSETQFKQNIAASRFQYQPPANAEVITY